jgi:hypothetical protein
VPTVRLALTSESTLRLIDGLNSSPKWKNAPSGAFDDN